MTTITLEESCCQSGSFSRFRGLPMAEGISAKGGDDRKGDVRTGRGTFSAGETISIVTHTSLASRTARAQSRAAR